VDAALRHGVPEGGHDRPLADHLLGQGLSVVLDSPSFWDTIPTKGAAIAARRGVPYYFIECICLDREELARRLADRPRLPSQPVEPVSGETVAPPGAYLRIDTIAFSKRLTHGVSFV
jgi:hypothetical protein